MGRLIAIGDIHGCLGRLRRLVNELRLTKDDKIIFLGDYIDRGMYSKEVIDYILNLKDAYDIVALRGNHEQMLLDFLDIRVTEEDEELYLYNGGYSTLKSYCKVPVPTSRIEIYKHIPSSHLNFLHNLPYSYETKDYFFSHAGARPFVSLSKQVTNDLLWIRDTFIYSPYNFGKKLIFGHTPMKRPFIDDNKIGIDTCAFKKEGKLTSIILPEETFIQVQ